MIGSFWNLCRACPSMPVDKLHSEYRSTYRWHEYTGPRQEVVRRPPQANSVPATGDLTNDVSNSTKHKDTNNDLSKLEPNLPRRKKYPDIAYRHNEFITNDKSTHLNGSWHNKSTKQGDSSLLKKAISKINTEYRLQFAWPHSVHTSRKDAANAEPRKSKSMGALKPSANAIIHRKRVLMDNKDASELEPLVDEKHNRDERRHDDTEFNTEYKKKFRPFSQYEYSEGRYTKKSASNKDDVDATNGFVNGDKRNDSWYQEVVELRKKAGEYKSRGWGSDLASEKINDIYNKQVELWDQVSRRSSLSALSLASVAHKNYSKQDKEEDNNKKSSPKAYRNADSAKFIRDIVRHHLERTTGGSELDGLILSPTREKLEPTIPRKDDDSRGSTKNSPKKSSPMKSSSLKRSNQRTSKSPRNIRSQSVGPTDTGEKKSPKRQSRSATVKERKSSGDNSSGRRPRPSDPEKDENEEEKPANADEKSQPISYEPVIKSPPEPTRVKSPEQIMMKSPDPVNWTVPLDTGKTFTVTQNVLEGDIGSRPHSEVKAWTPSEAPPPVAQSAPPSLVVLEKDHGL